MSHAAFRRLALVLPALVLLTACGGPEPAVDVTDTVGSTADPIAPGRAAYEIAKAAPLEDREPKDFDDLHNVFELSENIISGSEPHGEDALKRISEMGVKVVLSVDGKVPDKATAEKYGMRYVHVPIQYSGISPDERLRIAKVFRELEGPFFVHCFHGKHRGPAAAALGRVVKDGVPRERAVAEMQQWCGTSGKYEGLYETIARGAVPSDAETRALDWSFPAAHEFEGFRAVMIDASRAWDHLKMTKGQAFKANPHHPDLHAQNEARILGSLFERSLELADVKDKPEDFRAWLVESKAEAYRLQELVQQLKTAEDEATLQEANAAMGEIKNRCDACHKVYRNS